jgi:hypothetical protein
VRSAGIGEYWTGGNCLEVTTQRAGALWTQKEGRTGDKSHHVDLLRADLPHPYMEGFAPPNGTAKPRLPFLPPWNHYYLQPISLYHH